MEKVTISVFVDSDVVISSLLSDKGAAHLLIHQATIKRFISNISNNELIVVIERLGINEEALTSLLNTQLTAIKLNKPNNVLKEKFSAYVADINDSHIVAGAVESKAKFLLTYNLKHFHLDLIKKDFDITVLTPAKFLQYLRSLD
jgi:predicted nucleic acid-binding protein